MDDIKIADLDLYELLEIDSSSTAAEIKKAYRKKALQCHPDKNPDDAGAAKKFHQLSKILEVLTDEAARSAYDKVLKGKKEAAIRHRELDSKRRKLKEDLEQRERAAGKTANQKSADQLLKDEIERLRKEGSKEVEEEIEFVKRQLRQENSLNSQYWDSSKHRIKIKWISSKNDPTNGGYTQEMLHRFLSKYGDIQALVMSPKKKGSALVEFKDRKAAEMAVDLEVGLPENPLQFEWIDEPPRGGNRAPNTLTKASDFESITLTKMRQAEERKRLIEQMMAEDEGT